MTAQSLSSETSAPFGLLCLPAWQITPELLHDGRRRGTALILPLLSVCVVVLICGKLLIFVEPWSDPSTPTYVITVALAALHLSKWQIIMRGHNW